MTASHKTRILFICIGNSCRSQMAEAFARKYGSDVIIPASAGLSPAFVVAADTIRAMDDKNIDIRDQFPKSLKHLGRAQFDLFVNMSGYDLPPEMETPVLVWEVPDPIGEDFSTHCQIRDDIEARVMALILELRRGFPVRPNPAPR